eukprot:SAG31_NODE_1946_length_6844_cov_5.947665_4_plen_114_part_00
MLWRVELMFQCIGRAPRSTKIAQWAHARAERCRYALDRLFELHELWYQIDQVARCPDNVMHVNTDHSKLADSHRPRDTRHHIQYHPQPNPRDQDLRAPEADTDDAPCEPVDGR